MTRVRVRGWWLGPLLLVAIGLTPWPAGLIERVYSRGAYPFIQRVMTTISNLTPWAVMDLLLSGAAVYVLWRVIRAVAAARARGVGSAIWEFSRRIVRTSACIALVFLLVWGLNYRRLPLEHVLRGGAPAVVTASEITAMAEHAAAGARQMRPGAAPALETSEAIRRTHERLAARLEAPFRQALAQLGYPVIAVVGRPKVSKILTPFFTAAGVTGMVNPIVLESIVHPDLLTFEQPMVLAHEWAHLAGIADEADAAAVAWLTCFLGGEDLTYSAHVFVVIETAAALPRPAWRELRARLGPDVLQDLSALSARQTRQKPAVRETAFAVYDGYLKSNRVPDGVRSYSRVLRVLAAMRAAYPLSSLSRSAGVMGLEESPVRRSSGSASGPSVNGK